MSRTLTARLERQERAAGITPWDEYKGIAFADWPEATQVAWWQAVEAGAESALNALSDDDLSLNVNLILATLPEAEASNAVAAAD